jgi:hypothetical protein
MRRSSKAFNVVFNLLRGAIGKREPVWITVQLDPSL